MVLSLDLKGQHCNSQHLLGGNDHKVIYSIKKLTQKKLAQFIRYPAIKFFFF